MSGIYLRPAGSMVLKLTNGRSYPGILAGDCPIERTKRRPALLGRFFHAVELGRNSLH